MDDSSFKRITQYTEPSVRLEPGHATKSYGGIDITILGCFRDIAFMHRPAWIELEEAAGMASVPSVIIFDGHGRKSSSTGRQARKPLK
jgi:hypothetical protein